MRFKQLDTLRYLFAAIVVLGHTSGWDKAIPGGTMAVDFFFVLSGFVLTHSAITKAQNKTNVSKFIIARVARLTPLYFLSLLIIFTILFFKNNFPPIDFFFLQNILLLQNIIPNTSYGFNGPAWSISVEIWVNITIFLIIMRYRNVPITTIICLSCYLILLDKNIIDAALLQKIHFTTAGAFRCVGGLSLGYLTYEVFYYFRPTLNNSKNDLLKYSCYEIFIALTIIFYLFQNSIESRFAIIVILPFFIYIFACGKGAISLVFQLKLIRNLGSYSYGIYLLHDPLLIYLRNSGLLPAEALNTPLNHGFAVLLATTTIAIPVYRYFEVPFKHCIQNAFQRN